MNADLTLAKEELTDNGLTCSIRKGDAVYSSRERGVKPLLKLLDAGQKLTGFSAADRVVGSGAAFLYVLLEVHAVYAGVMSGAALSTLQRHGIAAEYGCLTDRIRNRSGDGFCPIESAVEGETVPAEALRKIRARLSEMKAEKMQND